MAPGIKEADMPEEGGEVTHVLKKESDRAVSEAKDHHCADGSEATGGIRGQKVTHAAEKRSDGGVARVKDHHCAGGSEATEGTRGQKVTHVMKK